MVNVAHNDGRRMKRRFLFGIGSFTPRNEDRTYQHQKQEGDRKGRDGSSGISIAPRSFRKLRCESGPVRFRAIEQR
jgi:hypothetical protein